MSLDCIETCAASELLLRNLHVDGRPGVVPGDGNCLFHTLSVLTFGDIGKSTELRHRTAVELILNSSSYARRNRWREVSSTLEEGITCIIYSKLDLMVVTTL